jgi:hypothetical protein
VFVRTRDVEAEGKTEVIGFSRDDRTTAEWANVFAAPPGILDGVDGFIFEHLAGMLPIPSRSLELCEVDTPADLDIARGFVANGYRY